MLKFIVFAVGSLIFSSSAYAQIIVPAFSNSCVWNNKQYSAGAFFCLEKNKATAMRCKKDGELLHWNIEDVAVCARLPQKMPE